MLQSLTPPFSSGNGGSYLLFPEPRIGPMVPKAAFLLEERGEEAMPHRVTVHEPSVAKTSPPRPVPPPTQQPKLPLPVRGEGPPCDLTYASESLARARQLTSFQSSSPVASVNESMACSNDSLPVTIHLPCFQGIKEVTKVTPLSTPSESIITPHKPPKGVPVPISNSADPAPKPRQTTARKWFITLRAATLRHTWSITSPNKAISTATTWSNLRRYTHSAT